MSADQTDQTAIVRTLLRQAGVSVPEEEIGKLAEMYRGADGARQVIRSARLGETEPVVVFAPEVSHE